MNMFVYALKFIIYIYLSIDIVTLFIITATLLCTYYYIYYKKCNSLRRKELIRDIMIDKFNPEPLYKQIPKEDIVEYNISTSKIGVRTQVQDRYMLNFASENFFNLIGNEDIEKVAYKTIYKYGVGSCGPRGFYGTVDVHLELEARIAKFMNTESSVVYSYGFSTIASAIPAYCKRGDVLFCDEKISFAAQKGMDAARSKVIYFKHNDVQDLREKLEEYHKKYPCNEIGVRKFLLLEGIYINTGKLCNLPAFIEMRSKYKLRLFLDETLSIGVLGKTGRGIVEHYNIDPTEIDLIVGSLEGLIGSIGGFCVGTQFIVEHQHLSGLGYCFSASLPPVLTRAAICAFDYLDNNSSYIFEKFRKKCEEVHNMLQRLPSVVIVSNKRSPIQYFQFVHNEQILDEGSYYKMFQEECLKNGLMIAYCSKYKKDDYRIKVCVNIEFKSGDINQAYNVMLNATEKLLESVTMKRNT